MIKKIILLLLVTSVFGIAQALTPKQIIEKIDKTERVESSKGKIKQIITTSGGEKRILEAEAISKNRNEKQLMKYISPKRISGDKILMLNDGDDIWFYTPRTDRVRHLASHAKRQKVQGSDFSYEDMAAGDYEKDYSYKLLGKETVAGRECYKFEMIPTERGPHYSKLILWADCERFLTLKIDYYEEGELLKRLVCEEVKLIDNHWTAMKLTMDNLQEGGKTVMETLEITYDIELADDLFTTKSLNRR